MEPKRPLSPFIYYSQEARKAIKRANPKLSAKKVMQQVQASWKQMTPEQQEPYRIQSEKERAEYEKIKREFEDQRAKRLNSEVLGESVLESVKHRREELLHREPPNT